MVGKQIRYYRQQKQLTQEQLAQGICSESYLSKIENDATLPSEEILSLLYERLNICKEDRQSEEKAEEVLQVLNHWYTLFSKIHIEKAKKYHLVVQNKLQYIQDPSLLLRYDLYYFRYLLLLKDFKAAREQLFKLELHNEHFSAELTYYFKHFTGVYYSYQSDYKMAITYLGEAENLIESLHLVPPESAELFYQLSLAHSRLNHSSLAIYYAERALTIFDKEYLYYRSIGCHIILGINQSRLHDNIKANNHYNTALKIAQSLGDDDFYGVIYHNLGYLHTLKHHHEQAINYYELSLKHKQSNAPEHIVQSMFLIAREYYYLNDEKKALTWANKGLTITSKHHLKDYDFHLQILKSKLKDVPVDITLLENAISFFQEKNAHQYVGEYAEFLADYYSSQFQYKNSSYYYSLANEARKSLLHERSE